jgi:uncharacterized protein
MKNMKKKLVISNNLNLIQKGNNGFFVYNKLLGNLALLDKKGKDFLCSFDADTLYGENYQKYVEELHNRFFLIEEGVNEQDLINKDKKYRLNHLESGYLIQGLQLVLTNDCNLGCSYCFTETTLSGDTTLSENKFKNIKILQDFTNKSANRNNRNMSSEIAISSVENTLEILAKNKNSTLSIEFFGGEPLLNWKTIEEVVKRFGLKSHGVNIHYSVTTNATVITNDIAKKLHDYTISVIVSYDSPSNEQRLTKRGTRANYLINKGLELLKQHNVYTTFNSVVSVKNVDYFDPKGLFEIAKNYNIKTIALILDLEVKPYYENFEKFKKIKDCLLNMCELEATYGIPVTGYWHQIFEQIVGKKYINLQKGYKTCAAEGCKISVEPNGSISNCKCGSKPIGNIHNIPDVFKTNSYKEYAMKAYGTTPYCGGCSIEGFCSGLCMGTLENSFNDVNRLIEPVCNVYRDLTDSLIKSYSPNETDKLYLENYLEAGE